MKAVVVYRSKSGFVKKYAQWIGEELGADVIEGSKVTPEKMGEYDAIVYGGGLYAIGINGVKLITSNLDKLRGKKIAVFASGASPVRPGAIAEICSQNFTKEQLQQIRFFYMRGGFDFNKLTLVDKILITLLKFKIRRKRKEARETDERGMLAAIDRPADFTRQRNIAELVKYIRE